MSNELDILIVASNTERFAPEIRTAFRHWQVYQCASPHALWGRTFRRAYFTEAVMGHVYGPSILNKLRERGEVVSFEDYQPEVGPLTAAQAEDLRQIRRARYAE